MAGRGSALINSFVDDSFVSLGFVNEKKLLNESEVEVFKKVFTDIFPHSRKAQITSGSSQLYRFINEMKVGENVVVYEPGKRIYHIGEVKTDTKYIDTDNEHSYRRDIKWAGTINRDDLTTGTRNALGGILTLYEINPEASFEIEQVLGGKIIEPQGESDDEEEIEDFGDETAEKAKEFLKDMILELSWEQMQDLVAGLLRAVGYKTRVSPAGPDRGKDIIASPDGLGLEDPRIHVEVKHRPNQAMGAPEVRAFVGGLRKNKGLYVSTGGFTKEAHYEAERSDVPVTLVDIDEMARMIIQYYDNFDTEAKSLLPLRKIYWPL